MLTPDDRTALDELAPVLRRAATLDPRSLARLRLAGESATVLVRLPFGVLVSRTVQMPPRAEPLDLAARATDLVAWLETAPDESAGQPEPRDLEWRTGLPPAGGWHRIDTVPDDVIRPLVRAGALALKDAARDGVPGTQPAGVADALLDSVVLTVSDDTGATAEVTLRMVSAVTRMGFLPRGGRVHVDLAGRWVRVVAEYGTVYLERPGQSLGLA